MAVISELIDAGLALKEQGNHQAAIEHFRQLHVTYPNHARIMFELAGSWQAFGVPERALPLYQALLDMPKTGGLPPKDVPRLYTQMGASLRLMGQFAESLQIIEAGLHQFPTYRPLRAYHMFALHSAGFHQNAMVESLKLMLESLAPTKWDVYEDEIMAIVEDIRERVPSPDTNDLADWEFDEFWGDEAQNKVANDDNAETDEPDDRVDIETIEEPPVEESLKAEDKATIDEPPASEPVVIEGKIVIDDDTDDNDEDESFDIQVKVVDKDNKKKKSTRTPKKDNKQFGKKAVKIDINTADDDAPPASKKAKTKSDDEPPASPTGKVDIPIEFD